VLVGAEVAAEKIGGRTAVTRRCNLTSRGAEGHRLQHLDTSGELATGLRAVTSDPEV
jgi:hypothetical protein